MKKKVALYTDGACSGNPGPGGYGAILKYNDREKELSGSFDDTTNNRMELEAVIRALDRILSEEALKNRNVEVITDSQYVKLGITDWIRKGVANGWKTAGKKQVKNKGLWMRLLCLSKSLNVRWNWVAGHSGEEYNELCDSMVKSELGRMV